MSEQPTCQKCHRRECRRIYGWASIDAIGVKSALECLQAQIDALKTEVERLKEAKEESPA